MNYKTEKKRLREQKVVGQMIALYCRKNHNTDYGMKNGASHDMSHNTDGIGGKLCDECSALCEYAAQRSRMCPFMEKKTFCSNCTVHCYKPEMRERIKKVMKFSGPRMLLYHPFMAVWHVVSSRLEKKKDKKGKT